MTKCLFSATNFKLGHNYISADNTSNFIKMIEANMQQKL